MDKIEEQQQQHILSIPHLSHQIVLLISLSGIIICIVVGIVIIFRTENSSNTGTSTSNGFLQKSPATPTPFPEFADMTIPYLRTRSYDSRLGEQTLYSQNGSYDTYLTNYDSDGYRINALLTKPTSQIAEGGWPAIIFIHGYIPPSVYETTVQYSAYVDYLARAGFVVFKIDLRGHGNSEGEAGGGYFGSDYVIDTLNAYAALAASGFVNPSRIGLWGHSMAGNISLRTFAVKPDIKAVVIWAGAVYSYTDRLKYGIQDNSYRPPSNRTAQQNRRLRLTELYGEPTDDSPFWRQVVPTNYLADLKGAIEIHHAIDDAVVNIGYSRDLMSLLDKTNVPHVLYEYESGGHNLEGNTFDEAMRRTVEFYKTHL